MKKEGGVDADGHGFAGGIRPGDIAEHVAYGPGISTNKAGYTAMANGGSGHGSRGDDGEYGFGGAEYGSSNAPVLPGSGARAGWAFGYDYQNGPNGGGSVQIRAEGQVILDGMMTANGGKGIQTYGPAASGGSIYIHCHTFVGTSNGILLANGGNAQVASAQHPWGGGGASGGRIAVWRLYDESSGTISNAVAGGLGGYYNNFKRANSGTIVWGMLPPPGTVILIW